VENRTLAVRSCLDGLRVRWVYEEEMALIDPTLESFVSVNTPEEWAAARSRLELGD
jgi:hypothetical protein